METIQSLSQASSLQFLYWGSSAAALIVLSLSIYRLYLHPLAKFPGPKLAALTQWVQSYYEICGEGGKFGGKIDEWHDLYGPVVRISPSEIHIKDEKFYDTFYSSTRAAHKRTDLNDRHGVPEAINSTDDHFLHRQRRAALIPYFSQRKVASHAPRIQALATKLSDILEKRFRDGSPIDALAMWGCFASDVIADYCFAQPTNFMESDGFQSVFVEGVYGMVQPVHFFAEFPWLMSALTSLPFSWQVALNPHAKPLFEFNKMVIDELESTRESLGDRQGGVYPPSKHQTKEGRNGKLFEALLQSSLPPSQLAQRRLAQEGMSLVGAAVETVSQNLTVATFHLLNNPDKLRRLRSELTEAAVLEGHEQPELDFDSLRQLPFLTACIYETRRLAIGVLSRSPRIFLKDLVLPDDPEYEGLPRVVKAGSAASMSAVDVLYSPKIFPDPHSFKPERWLADHRSTTEGEKSVARAPDGRPLTAYLVSFLKGTRSCLGMHIADAELYIAIATLVRRFGDGLQLADGVTVDSVAPYMDRFVPRPRPGAKKMLFQIGT